MNALVNESQTAESDVLAGNSGSPLVFISHDTRDAQLAEAFSKLLKSVSAGMIKTFRSSDKKVGEGIDFGEEWYKRLMDRLQATSDVVCLFTDRSLDRPWLLFEAGVAKGKLNTPVIGVALGVPLSRVTVGPFYQFQNMEDSEGDLIKLVEQLAKRISGLELDGDVVRAQVQAFKAIESDILKSLAAKPKTPVATKSIDDSSFAKIIEEIKTLPTRVAERLADVVDPSNRRSRRTNPLLLRHLLDTSTDSRDPVSILMLASFVKDEAPWLYEIAMESYRTVKSGNPDLIAEEMRRLRRLSEFGLHTAFRGELGYSNKESYYLMKELPRILERLLASALTSSGKLTMKKRSTAKRTATKKQQMVRENAS
jgi:hypothetical protein